MNDALDALFAQIEAENKAAQVAMPEPTAEEVAKEAKFLRGWSKGKPIAYTGGGTFYKCGKWATKIPDKVVAALLAGGHAVGDGRRFTMAKDGAK